MMFNSSNADLKHFFRATKSLTSALYVGEAAGGARLTSSPATAAAPR